MALQGFTSFTPTGMPNTCHLNREEFGNFGERKGIVKAPYLSSETLCAALSDYWDEVRITYQAQCTQNQCQFPLAKQISYFLGGEKVCSMWLSLQGFEIKANAEESLAQIVVETDGPFSPKVDLKTDFKTSFTYNVHIAEENVLKFSFVKVNPNEYEFKLKADDREFTGTCTMGSNTMSCSYSQLLGSLQMDLSSIEEPSGIITYRMQFQSIPLVSFLGTKELGLLTLKFHPEHGLTSLDGRVADLYGNEMFNSEINCNRVYENSKDRVTSCDAVAKFDINLGPSFSHVKGNFTDWITLETEKKKFSRHQFDSFIEISSAQEKQAYAINGDVTAEVKKEKLNLQGKGSKFVRNLNTASTSYTKYDGDIEFDGEGLKFMNIKERDFDGTVKHKIYDREKISLPTPSSPPNELMDE